MPRVNRTFLEANGRDDFRKPGVFRDIGKEILELLANCYNEMPLEDVKKDLENGFQGSMVHLRPGPQGSLHMHIEFLYFDGNFYPFDFIFPSDQSWDKKYLAKLITHELRRGPYAFGPTRELMLEQQRERARRLKKIKRMMKTHGITRGHAEQVLDGVAFLE